MESDRRKIAAARRYIETQRALAPDSRTLAVLAEQERRVDEFEARVNRSERASANGKRTASGRRLVGA